VDDWEQREDIYIQASVILRDKAEPARDRGRARIEGSHSNVTYIGVFARVLRQGRQEPPIKSQLSAKTICGIVSSLKQGLHRMCRAHGWHAGDELAASDAGLQHAGQAWAWPGTARAGARAVPGRRCSHPGAGHGGVRADARMADPIAVS